MRPILKKHAEKLRFGIIGGINTAIDFGILFILVGLGLPSTVGNIISTSIALSFSFFANKSFTFKAEEKITKSQITIFLVITLFGLWVIQPVIIYLVGGLLTTKITNSFVVLFIGKLIATVATLIWNYLLYRKFVFRR